MKNWVYKHITPHGSKVYQSAKRDSVMIITVTGTFRLYHSFESKKARRIPASANIHLERSKNGKTVVIKNIKTYKNV